MFLKNLKIVKKSQKIFKSFLLLDLNRNVFPRKKQNLLFFYFNATLYLLTKKLPQNILSMIKEDSTMEKAQEVYDYLKKNNIPFEIIEHEPVYTMEEMDNYGITKKGNICKNLFLRDAKGRRHFLVVLGKDKTADLKYISDQLHTTKLSFASDERLEKYLGAAKGAVSPMGLIHDKDGEVEVVFDKDFQFEKRFGCHPNENTATVILDFKDLKKMIQKNGNEISFLTFK